MTSNHKRCKCGKVKFSSLAEAQAEIDKQRIVYDTEYNAYVCAYTYESWHITSANTIKNTQLVLGELQKKNILVLKFPDAKYLAISPDKYLSKNILESINHLWRPKIDKREVDVWVIAKKLNSDTFWRCEDPWVTLEIDKHKHREINIVSEIRPIYMDRKQFIQVLGTFKETTEQSYNRQTQETIRDKLKLRDIDTIIPPKPAERIRKHVVKEKVIKEIREVTGRKFITLSSEGLSMWEQLTSLLAQGENISKIIEDSLRKEVRHRLILRDMFK